MKLTEKHLREIIAEVIEEKFKEHMEKFFDARCRELVAEGLDTFSAHEDYRKDWEDDTDVESGSWE